jgi:MFS family permease
MNPPAAPTARRAAPSNRAAALVIAAGVAAALHVGKLPPALPVLQAELQLTLVQAGFLLSLVQAAGMSAGLAFGALADGLGGRRSLLLGLWLLVAASVLGGAADGAAVLMALRALEGCGFLLVVLPAPGLVRQRVAPGRVAAAMGVWGAYMPLATALALLLGPVVIAAAGWRSWWWGLALVTALAALACHVAVPALAAADGDHAAPPPAAAADAPRARAAGGIGAWWRRVVRTLGDAGPWLVAVTFAAYSAQWLAVVGFLPTLVAAAGWSAAATGVLTALVAAANIVGNVAGGRALQRGAGHGRLLAGGFGAMALGAIVAYAGTAEQALLPPALRYAGLLLFSGGGGLIPATLFALALKLAPAPDATSTTLGWVQQWSALGQFAGPPLVAWVASAVGGWQHTGWVTAGFCGLGLLLARALALRQRAPAGAATAAARR